MLSANSGSFPKAQPQREKINQLFWAEENWCPPRANCIKRTTKCLLCFSLKTNLPGYWHNTAKLHTRQPPRLENTRRLYGRSPGSMEQLLCAVQLPTMCFVLSFINEASISTGALSYRTNFNDNQIWWNEVNWMVLQVWQTRPTFLCGSFVASCYESFFTLHQLLSPVYQHALLPPSSPLLEKELQNTRILYLAQ